MKLRKYQTKDCVIMAELFYHTVHTINKKDYTQEQLEVWADGNMDLIKWNLSFLENNTLLIEEKGRIVGFGDMDATGYLDRLYVHKDYQGKGIATTILKTLENQVERKQINCFTTYTSITAKPFFTKMGYHIKKENIVIKKGISLKNYQMEKQIR